MFCVKCNVKKKLHTISKFIYKTSSGQKREREKLKKEGKGDKVC